MTVLRCQLGDGPDDGIKASILTMLNDTKKNVLLVNEKKGNINR